MQRGEIWWADLREPSGSEPGYRRPVLIAQTNWFTNSRIQTVIVVALTSKAKACNKLNPTAPPSAGRDGVVY